MSPISTRKPVYGLPVIYKIDGVKEYRKLVGQDQNRLHEQDFVNTH